MTGPAADPPPELLRARRWSADLAAALDEITGQVGAAARRLAEGWPDAHGRDWVDRLRGLQRDLTRDLDASGEFGRSVDRVAYDTASGPAVGPYLGATTGRRADDRRGVTVPQLGDPTDGGG